MGLAVFLQPQGTAVLGEGAIGDFATGEQGREFVPFGSVQIADPTACSGVAVWVNFYCAAVQQRAVSCVPCGVNQVFVRVQQQAEKAGPPMP